jgi:hypothetical protein
MHLTLGFAASKDQLDLELTRGRGSSMKRVVAYLCGLWFWLTRRRRVDVYCAAAETLELAHAYLLRDFASRASTRDRGLLLPQHNEALSILQNHAVETYVAATRLTKLRDCCRFVAEELRQLDAPAVATTRRPAPVVLRPVPATSGFRVRFAPNRVLRFSLPGPARLPNFARFLSAETSGSIWDRPIGPWRIRSVADPALTAEPAKQPLKAA